MRKQTFPNFSSPNRSRNRIMQLFKDGILRRTNGYGESKYLNELCAKLNDAHGSKFLTQTNESSVVVINDKRKEVGRMQNRSLITTGLIYDELLQVNRGKQNYEDERNKFFTQDDTGNARWFNSDDYLPLLDLLWYMEEQKLGAIEIMGDTREDAPPTYYSSRYHDKCESLIKPLFEEGSQRCLDIGNEYLDIRAKINNGTVDFFGSRNPNSNLMDSFMEDHSWYNSDMKLLKSYLDYRKELLYDDKTGEYDKVVTDYLSWSEFLTDTIKLRALTQRQLSTAFLASAFGLSDVANEDLGVDLVTGTNYTYATWKTVAHSKFKRNQDWCVNELTFYKTEVLKLRSNLLEGSFNE